MSEHEDAKQSRTISHPAHYTYSAIEPIQVIRAWGLNFELGNVIKYVARADHKGKRRADIEKAIRYLQMELERMDAERGS